MVFFLSRTLKRLNQKYFDLILMARQRQHRGKISESRQLYVQAEVLLNRINTLDAMTYPVVKRLTGMDHLLAFRDQFAEFYKALCARPAMQANNSVIALEQIGNTVMQTLCPAGPLQRDEIRELEVFWQSEENKNTHAQNVFVTRLQAHYNAATFVDHIMLQHTEDQTLFHSSYVLSHTWTGDTDGDPAKEYEINLSKHDEQEAQALPYFTGRDNNSIRHNMAYTELVDSQTTQPAQPPTWLKGL